MPQNQQDVQAIRELKNMARMYSARGNAAKSAELLALAKQMEDRVQRSGATLNDSEEGAERQA